MSQSSGVYCLSARTTAGFTHLFWMTRHPFVCRLVVSMCLFIRMTGMCFHFVKCWLIRLAWWSPMTNRLFRWVETINQICLCSSRFKQNIAKPSDITCAITILYGMNYNILHYISSCISITYNIFHEILPFVVLLKHISPYIIYVVMLQTITICIIFVWSWWRNIPSSKLT